MDLDTAIRTRRSIRHFEDRPIPNETLQQVLEAIQWAPSWANTQCWEVIVVDEPGLKEGLKEALGRNPASKAVVAAPVSLVLCGRKDRAGFYKGKVTTKLGDWMLYDLGIACQNAALAGHEAGLGSVVVGLFDHDRVSTLLNVPQEYQVVSIMPMGFPAREGKAPPRRAVEEFTHRNGFEIEEQ